MLQPKREIIVLICPKVFLLWRFQDATTVVLLQKEIIMTIRRSQTLIHWSLLRLAINHRIRMKLKSYQACGRVTIKITKYMYTQNTTVSVPRPIGTPSPHLPQACAPPPTPARQDIGFYRHDMNFTQKSLEFYRCSWVTETREKLFPFSFTP